MRNRDYSTPKSALYLLYAELGAIMQTAVTRTVMDVVTRIEAERQRTDEVECYF